MVHGIAVKRELEVGLRHVKVRKLSLSSQQ